MSLWHKRMSEVTYADLEAFCQAGISEGVQVEYKSDIPKSLEKTIAAFANTRGGLLLLGVEADATTNTPVWPSPGMPRRPGYAEQITQICLENIYPPILADCSNVLAASDDSRVVFVAVRVDESPEAPHTIRNRTQVFVRSGATTERFELATIDRIAMLLDRRRAIADAREQLIARGVDRAVRSYPSSDTYVWWACVPEFPHDHLCTLNDCQLGVYSVFPSSRAPDGYLGVGSETYAGGDNPKDRVIASAGRRGDLFFSRGFRVETMGALLGGLIADYTLSFLLHAQCFYNRPEIRTPGLLHLAIGFDRVAGKTMSVLSRNVGGPTGAGRRRAAQEAISHA